MESILEQKLQAGGATQKEGWPWHLLLLSGVTFLTIIVIYLGMEFGLAPYLDKQSKNVDQQINKLSSLISEQEVDNFSSFYSQLNNIQNLLKNHDQNSNFISFLEKNTLNTVYFKTMSLDWGTRTAKFDGTSLSYSTLSQQIEVLKQSPEVLEVHLDGASLNQEKGGGVNFSIRVNLNK